MENETKRKCIKCDEELTDEEMECDKTKVEALRKRIDSVIRATSIGLDMNYGEVMEALYQSIDKEENQASPTEEDN